MELELLKAAMIFTDELVSYISCENIMAYEHSQ